MGIPRRQINDDRQYARLTRTEIRAVHEYPVYRPEYINEEMRRK